MSKLNPIVLSSVTERLMDGFAQVFLPVIDLIIEFVGVFIVPIIAIFCAICFFTELTKAGLSGDKMKGQIEEHLKQFILLVIVFSACASFSVWIIFFKI